MKLTLDQIQAGWNEVEVGAEAPASSLSLAREREYKHYVPH